MVGGGGVILCSGGVGDGFILGDGGYFFRGRGGYFLGGGGWW